MNSQRDREQRIEEGLQRGTLRLARASDAVRPTSPTDSPCHGCLESGADTRVDDEPWHRLCALYWQGRSEGVRSERIPHIQPGPGITPARSRWVIVVPMGQPATYAAIRRRFGRSPWVDVVIDRRRGERRQQPGESPFAERRRTKRRNAMRDELTGESQFRLAHHVDGCEVYEATTPESGLCADCGVAVSFELPRFAEPPVRLELVIRHELTPTGPRHSGELQSFSPTGRVVLSTRLVGRIRTDSR